MSLFLESKRKGNFLLASFLLFKKSPLIIFDNVLPKYRIMENGNKTIEALSIALGKNCNRLPGKF